jgi:GT2 family glycosyltransferase
MPRTIAPRQPSAATSPRVTVIENATNRGYVEAHNQGITWALSMGVGMVFAAE